jgi:ABC-2 type transport system ATP-binding protein
MTEPVVEVSAITKRFNSLCAVDGISFSVQAGEIFGLVGPDGAGKTTMLRMLAGVLECDGGWAKIAGHDIRTDPERIHCEIGYMPQGFGSYEDLTVDENIRFFADLFGVSARQRAERAAQFLAAYGMSEFRRRLAGHLSGGMKKKLALICSLIHTPRLLLLDEPTTGVDPVSRREFWSILYSLLSQGVTVVIATAYLDEAERCHRLALLHRGGLLFCATPAELKASLPGTVVSISSPESRAVRTALTGAPGVLGAVLMGDVVHLVVDDGARRIPELRRLLVEAPLPFGDIGETPATVEDVFVHAVREAETRSRGRS